MATKKEIKIRISHFVTFYKKSEGQIIVKKLSDLYNSRTTKYASIYNTDLFVIYRDAESIAKYGFSKLCKAIITLNESNPTVLDILAELRKDNEAKILTEQAEKELYEKRVTEAKDFIANKDNHAVILKEANKVCNNFGENLEEIKNMPSKMQQQLAWFLLKYFTNNSKTAIFHAL